jgi:hypothetical protein
MKRSEYHRYKTLMANRPKGRQRKKSVCVCVCKAIGMSYDQTDQRVLSVVDSLILLY